MNIINIVNGVIENNIDTSIICAKKKDNIIIDVKDNTEFCIYVENEISVDRININIDKNLDSRIFLILKTQNKLNIVINILENSKVLLNKFTDAMNLEENVDVYLEGINSEILYYHSCSGNIKENLNIYHNNKNTNSTVRNYGISNNETQEFNIVEKVEKGKTNCKLSQKSKIINSY